MGQENRDKVLNLVTETRPSQPTQQPPTEVGGLVTYGLKVRIRVD